MGYLVVYDRINDILPFDSATSSIQRAKWRCIDFVHEMGRQLPWQGGIDPGATYDRAEIRVNTGGLMTGHNTSYWTERWGGHENTISLLITGNTAPADTSKVLTATLDVWRRTAGAYVSTVQKVWAITWSSIFISGHDAADPSTWMAYLSPAYTIPDSFKPNQGLAEYDRYLMRLDLYTESGLLATLAGCDLIIEPKATARTPN